MHKKIIWCFILIFMSLQFFALAKEPKSAIVNNPTESFFSDVKIGDYTVFKLGSTNSLTHSERAEIINNRINNILKNKKQIPKAVIVPYGEKNLIEIDDQVILTVTMQDTHDNLKPLQQLSKEWAEKLDTAIKISKENMIDPIIIDGAIIFKVGPTEYLNASERAEIVNRRLRSFIDNPGKINPTSLSKNYGEWTISIGNVVLLTVVENDARLNSLKIEYLTKKWSKLVDKALERAKNERSPNHIVFVSAIIALFLIALFISYKVLKFAKDHLIKVFSNKKSRPRIQRYSRILIKLIYLMSIFALIIYTGIFLMDLSPYSRPYLNTFLQDIPNIYNNLISFVYNNFIIIVIAIFTIVILRIADFTIIKIFNFLSQEVTHEKTDRFMQRADTLKSIITNISKVSIVCVGFLLITNQLSINLMPILASAGILGLAISFGAQNLVKDVINGFFIVFEDQYGVGDVITVDDKTGLVEKMNLRITQIRGLDGSLTTIPNSQVNIVTNQSKEWSRAILDIGININEDVERAMEVIMRAANKLKEDWSSKIIENPVMLGVDKVENSQMIIKMMVKTVPLEQWDVIRELRKRIKLEFDKENIELPFPQQIVWLNGNKFYNENNKRPD